MKSILVLTTTYPRWVGDTQPEFVHQLCCELTRKFNVHVLAPHYPGASLYENLDGVSVHRFRYWIPKYETLAYGNGILANLRENPIRYLLFPVFLLVQQLHIRKLVRKHKVQLIHAHWLVPQGLNAVASRWLSSLRPKLLCTAHGADLFALGTGLLGKLVHGVVRRTDAVTVVSQAMCTKLETDGVDADRIIVSSMGVDLIHRFAPSSDAKRVVDLVFVGRLASKKGVHTLIEAFSILKGTTPNLSLVIVGDGEERSRLETLVDNLDLREQIRFVGAVEPANINQYYQAAKIAVVPSVVADDGDQEGLGLVAVEALGCECATIVSDLPALADVITDGETGVVFKAGDAEHLAACIAQLLNDPKLRERLSKKGREYVLTRFDWSVVGARYAQLIQQLIDEKGA